MGSSRPNLRRRGPHELPDDLWQSPSTSCFYLGSSSGGHSPQASDDQLDVLYRHCFWIWLRYFHGIYLTICHLDLLKVFRPYMHQYFLSRQVHASTFFLSRHVVAIAAPTALAATTTRSTSTSKHNCLCVVPFPKRRQPFPKHPKMGKGSHRSTTH